MKPDDSLFRAFALAVAAVLGCNVGSFLNVVAYRLPLGLSVVRPRSRCPRCLTPIRATDNVPVLSWLLLRGRCRGCKGRISPRYAAVELLTGLLAMHVVAVLVVWPGRLADGMAWAHAAAVFAFVAGLVAASLVDLDHRILPDEITIAGMWAAPAVAAFVPERVLGRALDVPSWVPEAWPLPLQAALVSGVGIAVGAGLLWGLGTVGTAVFGKEAMGFGDVKLLGAIGGFTGWIGVLLTIVIASVVGSVVGIARLRITGDRYLAFGPFLALGGYVAMLHGRVIVEAYLALI